MVKCLIWSHAVISYARVYPGKKISMLLMFIQLTIKGSLTIQPQVRSLVLMVLLSRWCSSSFPPPGNGKSLKTQDLHHQKTIGSKG